ncbi:hypothetical protein M0R45_019496 [Rubus argutus]|uniref:Uncharacterized protein n=1 Tax=Rubus argutus TaxID=59490 RepID=A0AAW1X976_RUBAR
MPPLPCSQATHGVDSIIKPSSLSLLPAIGAASAVLISPDAVDPAPCSPKPMPASLYPTHVVTACPFRPSRHRRSMICYGPLVLSHAVQQLCH